MSVRTLCPPDAALTGIPLLVQPAGATIRGVATVAETEQTAAATSARFDLLDELRQSYKSDYEAVHSSWRNLEVKAQGTIAVSSILLGGALAFGKADHLWTAWSGERLALTACVAVTAAAVCCALLALRVQFIPIPNLGPATQSLVDDLLALPAAELADRLPEFVGDIGRQWQAASLELTPLLYTKVQWVTRAQHLLAAAMLGFVLIVLSSL